MIFLWYVCLLNIRLVILRKGSYKSIRLDPEKVPVTCSTIAPTLIPSNPSSYLGKDHTRVLDPAKMPVMCSTITSSPYSFMVKSIQDMTQSVECRHCHMDTTQSLAQQSHGVVDRKVLFHDNIVSARLLR